MPSYRCDLKGECGEMVKVAVWNDRYILECEKGGFKETEYRKITIPYIKEVMARCRRCPVSVSNGL
ncbi:MAG: hypothetical protein NWF12_05675 [Candidatus Bathyarchaeota archaeon]|nr:hypothetical protein [Candidatus Bathyarchaeota archaeon]